MKVAKNINKVPELRFSEFNENWEIEKYGGICNISTGSCDTQDKVEVGEYDFYVRSEQVESINSPSNEGEAILTSGDGAGVGKIYHLVKGKYAVHQRVYILNKFIEKVKIDYCYYHFSTHFKKRVLRLSAKNSVDSVRKSMISEMPINIPSLPEQQKIASFLSTVDKKINLLESKIEHLEQYKKGVVQKIFKQEIRFKQGDSSDFPAWEKKKGNELFSSVSNKDHNGELPILAITQEYGAIPRDKIEHNITVTKKSVASYKKVEKGDFIISLRSFQGGIEYSNYDGICSPAYIILRNSIPINDYLYKVYMKTPNYIKELCRKLEGIRDGKMISYKYFSEIDLPYPSIKEQTKIANFLSSLDKKIDLHKTQLEKMKTWKKGLLQKMFV